MWPSEHVQLADTGRKRCGIFIIFAVLAMQRTRPILQHSRLVKELCAGRMLYKWCFHGLSTVRVSRLRIEFKIEHGRNMFKLVRFEKLGDSESCKTMRLCDCFCMSDLNDAR